MHIAEQANLYKYCHIIILLLVLLLSKKHAFLKSITFAISKDLPIGAWGRRAPNIFKFARQLVNKVSQAARRLATVLSVTLSPFLF